jgi:1-deoxy-D-xylulose-5-phosphate synthase
VGALVLDAIDQLGQAEHRPAPAVEVLGVPIEFLAHGKPDQILARLGLDADGIVRSIRAALA